MRKKSWSFSIGLSFSIMLSLIFTPETWSQSSKVIKWQYALGPTVIDSQYQFYQEIELPRRIKEVTKGALEIIPHKELVKAADILDAVRDRRVDMGVQGTMYRGDLALANYVSFPVILPYEALPKIHTKVEPIFVEWFRTQFGVETLGFGYWARQLLFSNRPAGSFKDLQGLKFRTHSYELLQLMKEIGGAPVSMPYMEVYLALQRKAIDGGVTSLVAARAQKWYEVAKYVDWWPLGNTAYHFLVNKDSWNNLPANLQKTVRETVSKIGFETWAGGDRDDKGIEQEFTKELGCTHVYPSKEEIAELGKMMGAVVADWKKRAGPRSPEVMAIINQTLGTQY